MRYKEILIHIAGTTPQLITETIYGLIYKDPPVYIDELYIITTATGIQRIEEELIKKGRLESFYKEFKIKRLLPEFFIIKDQYGNPLEDIREEDHNEIVGNLIVDIIREKTKDHLTRLHCSLAGGRKTMSFYIGSALQLFGRPWDRLYHILVTPEFESHPDFYWKPEKDRVIKGRDGKMLNTKDARIYLAELPFICLREKLSLNGKSFRELVKEGQEEIDTAITQPDLIVNLKERSLNIGGIIIRMDPLYLILYTYLLRKKLEYCINQTRSLCINCTECFPRLVDDLSDRKAFDLMIKDYIAIYGKGSGFVEKLKRGCKEGMDADKVRQNMSKINRRIKEHLTDYIQPYFIITSIGRYGNARYGIKVDRTRIGIVGDHPEIQKEYP